MARKLIVALTLVLILVVSVPVAYAALNDSQQKEINGLVKQMLEIRKQIIDKYVAAGELTPEQGKVLKDRIDQMYKYRVENGGFGPGFGGMMGPGGCGGPGMMGSPGMMGGWGLGPGAGQARPQNTVLPGRLGTSF